jgi:hypothetical protein
MTDTRSIEVFVHDGRAAFSGALDYKVCANQPCEVIATGGGSGATLSATAWEMHAV